MGVTWSVEKYSGWVARHSGVLQIVLHGWQEQAPGSSFEELGQGGGKTAGWISSALQECWGISGND